MGTERKSIIEVDSEKQTRAKEYARIRRKLMFVNIVIGFGYLLVWVMTGLSKGLASRLAAITNNDWFLVFGFALVFGGVFSLITFPMSYYSGFVLPHKFGLSSQGIKEWIVEQIKGFLVSLVLGFLLVEVAYAIFRASPDVWWLYLAAFILVFNVILANLAPVLIFPIFYKFTPLEEKDADLAERLLKLSEKAGTKVSGVYTFDMSRKTKEANAALTGLGNTRRIIVGDTLLGNFTHDEIETILAHELGHHVNRDVILGIGVQTTITILGFYLASKLMAWGSLFWGFKGISDVAAMPLLGLVLSLYSFITIPLENAYSRWREKLADLYALRLTNNGEAFASAMRRLADQNLAEVEPEPWVEFLLYSHPSLGKRIRLALNYKAEK